MSDLLAPKANQMANSNPSNAPATANPNRKRVPMSVPNRRLQVPEIPGYKTRWMLGTSSRIEAALQGGYEFVRRDEVQMNVISPANPRGGDGNTDLGDRVSIASGGDLVEAGQTVRLYLMKIRQEFWDEDQKIIDEQHEQIAAALRSGQGFMDKSADADNSNRYTPDGRNRNIFTKRRA